MQKSFIDQLFNFLANPAAIIAIGIAILLVVRASRSRPTGWFLFSLCCFAASLSKFKDRWTLDAPHLVFPLEQIRSFGRPLAVVLLILLVILALTPKNSWRQWILPQPIKYLIAVQGLIVFKTILYGSIEFAMLSALTFGGVIFMLKNGPGKWLQNDENFYLAVRSVAIVGVIFVVLNTYQFAIDRYAVTFHHGRFLGTTGNPIHASILLSAVIPCLMFLFQRCSTWNFVKFMWAVTLIIVMYFLFLTGSRTGLLIGVISIFLFYRSKGGSWVPIVIGVAIVAALAMPLLESPTLSTSAAIDNTVDNRFASTEDTRSAAWQGMWNGFQNNIVFGSPLSGDRLGYGENSWLAAADQLGLVGFIPMLMVGWESLKLLWQVNLLSLRQPHYSNHCNVVIAGLGSLLIGSVFEPFLLGNITFSLFAFLTYLLMGAYLIEVERAHIHYLKVSARSIEQPGVYQ